MYEREPHPLLTPGSELGPKLRHRAGPPEVNGEEGLEDLDVNQAKKTRDENPLKCLLIVNTSRLYMLP